MKAVLLLQVVAFHALQLAAKEVATFEKESEANKHQTALNEAMNKATHGMSRAEEKRMQADKVIAEAKGEMKRADAEKDEAEHVAAKAGIEMRLAVTSKLTAEQATIKAKNEMKHADAEIAKAEQVTSKEIRGTKNAEAKQRQAEWDATKANYDRKHAVAIKAKTEHAASMEIAKLKEIVVEYRQAEEALVGAKDEAKQANAAKVRAEQASANMEREVEHRKAEKLLAEQVSAKAVEKLRKEDSTVVTMTSVLIGLSVIALMLVTAVAFLGKKLSNMEQALAEPLLEEAASESTTPKLKPFEGRWRKEDGTVVQIDGDKLVHDDGRVETVADLEAQTLYTHRISIKKGWFAETPVVRGSSGKVEENKCINWHDGRVWVRAEGTDDSIFGA